MSAAGADADLSICHSRLRGACVQGDIPLARLLLAGSVDAEPVGIDDAIDCDQSTALHYAVSYGRCSLARFLLDAGAKVDCKTVTLQTPLMFATDQSIAELLCARGADLSARSLLGLDVLGCVKRGGNPGAIRVVEAELRRRRARRETGWRPLRARCGSSGSGSSMYRPGDEGDSSSGSDGDTVRRSRRGGSESAVLLAEVRDLTAELSIARRKLDAEKARAKAECGLTRTLREQLAEFEVEKLRLMQRCAAQDREISRLSSGGAPDGVEARLRDLPATSKLDGLSAETLRQLDAEVGSYHAAVKKAIADQSCCVVCHEGDQTVILMPCRHQVLCSGCAELVQQCPLCRAQIKDRFTPYKA
eukprot:TRINITY_DN6758_c4_g1_i1.p1 TRINITY_DN6758_c4_g1~~TRINITY_DN6758_c4_g1_i1.p1  ORF type:complete len:377 (+),score=96.43 TRINITY_DN6758_c4_g1_i1:50-1132(+)